MTFIKMQLRRLHPRTLIEWALMAFCVVLIGYSIADASHKLDRMSEAADRILATPACTQSLIP